MTVCADATASGVILDHIAVNLGENRDELSGPTIGRHRLGLELRRLREVAGLRLEDAAAELGVAPSTLSRIETGKAPVRTSYVRVLADRYGLTSEDEIRQLTDLAREGQRKGWWADSAHHLPAGLDRYLGLEAAAGIIRTFAAHAIPGLLQTSHYAAAACQAARPGGSADEIRALAAVTVRRKKFLRDGHQVHAIIDESALLRTVGTSDIMAEQLAHLQRQTASPSLTIQVLALSRPRGLLSDSFTVLTFPDPADPDIACHVSADEQSGLVRPVTASALRNSFDVLSSAAMSVADSATRISEIAAAA
jgi:transcriptional regulator with XRE-family HTH domain